MHRFLFFLPIVCCWASCTNQPQKDFSNLFETTETVVLSEVMPELKKELQAPKLIYAQEQYLVFSEPKSDSLLYIYDVETYIGKHFLPKGQGVNEGIKINTVGYGGTPECIYAYDLLQKTTFFLSLQKDSFPENIGLKKDSLQFRVAQGAVAYDDTLSFYENVNAKKRFTLLTPHLNQSFGNDFSIRSLSPEIISKILVGPCILSSANKKFVWFSNFCDAMEIYDYSNITNIQSVCSLMLTQPEARNDGAMTLEGKICTVSIACNNQYIYALYSGKTFKEILEKKDQTLYSDKILVFDWDGNPCKDLALDRNVFSITWSEHDNCLYGLGIDDSFDYAIYKVE